MNLILSQFQVKPHVIHFWSSILINPIIIPMDSGHIEMNQFRTTPASLHSQNLMYLFKDLAIDKTLFHQSMGELSAEKATDRAFRQ